MVKRNEGSSADALEEWAGAELRFLLEELDLLAQGGKVISREGEDISLERQERLRLRIDHVTSLLLRYGA